MPTAKKEQDILALEKRISESTIAIATDYSGMSVTDMTTLRRSLRGQGVDFRVVKNTLTYRAADSAGKPELKEVVKGPTGVAFGYGEVTESAKALTEFIRETSSALKVRGAVMGNRILNPAEVEALGRLPSKAVLIAKLAGQLQGGISGLVYVLSAPISGLARVLQAHVDASPAPEAATEPAPEPEAAPEPEPVAEVAPELEAVAEVAPEASAEPEVASEEAAPEEASGESDAGGGDAEPAAGESADQDKDEDSHEASKEN
jgi:large subunit ribosomal protein L10